MAVASLRQPCTRGDACDGYSSTTACPMVTMASGLAVHTQEKVLCHYHRLHIPFWLLRPPDTPLRQCSMHTSSTVGAPYEANLHPNPQYVCPAAAKQASAVHWTLCKPIASHKTALHTHEPPLWHMGPTAPKLAVRRLCGAGTESEPQGR